MNKWEKKITVRKGKIGEDIVCRFLIGKGYVPYLPNFDGPHPFDIFAVKKGLTKTLVADIKTKPRRIWYPDTGFNVRSFEKYIDYSRRHNMPTFVFFVDEEEKWIYGNFLKKLQEACTVKHKGKKLTYPIEENGIIYFPLKKMIKIAPISPRDVLQLKNYSSRKSRYDRLYAEEGDKQT